MDYAIQHPILKSILFNMSTLLLLIFGCAAQAPLNDFFGIKMNFEDQQDFQIKSYSVQKGASYSSNMNMDNRIYAWAEMSHEAITIRVINTSDQAIPINYNMDRFVLITNEGKEFVLDKGTLFAYSGKNQIDPGGSCDFHLKLPENFWDTIGMQNVQSHTADYLKDFWTGLNKMVFLKETIDLLIVELAGPTTIVLKPVPESK